MATFYLDVDDEITSAAAKIRSSKDPRVALVLPPGSRVATSRMNFRLLAREAQERNRRLSIVVPDAAVRALAGSAGLPVFATVGEYEAAEAEALAARREGGHGTTVGSAEGTAEIAGAAGAASAAAKEASGKGVATASHGTATGRTNGKPGSEPGLKPRSAAAKGVETNPKAKPRGRRLGFASILTLGLLVLVLVAVGVAGYLLLPSATIALTPRDESVGPVALTVHVDPAIGTAQPDKLAIPGTVQQFAEQASGTYQATGIRVDKTKATGSVELQNCDTSSGHDLAAGTVASTTSGVRFTLDHAVHLDPATLVPGQPGSCTTKSMTVTAVTPGLIGNVPAGAIKKLAGVNPTLIFVTNPAATSGGKETPHKIVQQVDLDNAKASLSGQLNQNFQNDLSAPKSLAPGVKLFPETGQLGQPTFSPADPTLVGTQADSFDLVASANGTALVADLATARTVGESRIRGLVPAGWQLDESSLAVSVGSYSWDGSAVSVPVSASALIYRIPDKATLLGAIKGKSADEAKAYLAKFGQVELSLWPGWVSSVPTLDFRIDFEIRPRAASAPTDSSAPPGPSDSGTPAFSSSPASGASASGTAGAGSTASGSAGPSPSR